MRTFDLRTGAPAGELQAASDTVNGVSFHPGLQLLATASGHRTYPLAPPTDSDSDDPSSGSEQPGGQQQHCVLQVWSQ